MAHRWLPEDISPELLQKPLGRDAINAFTEKWSGKYFPLSYINLLESGEEQYTQEVLHRMMQFIPVEPHGYDNEEDTFDYGFNIRELTYLIISDENPGILDDTFTELLQEYLDLDETIPIVRPHIDYEELDQALHNTTFKNLTLLVDYFSSATDNIFLDTSPEYPEPDTNLNWDDETIKFLIEEWKEATNLIERLQSEVNNFLDDPTDYTLTLIDTINHFVSNRPQP